MEKANNRESGAPDIYPAGFPQLSVRHVVFSFNYLIDYWLGRRTPSRILIDATLAEWIPTLQGKTIEIGASKNQNYKRFSSDQENYILSNLSKQENLLRLDAMNLDLPESSIDNLISIAMLEHLPDPWKALDEAHRVLKPGGKLVLIVPFMFPFHAFPGDFFRFTDQGLAILLEKFNILQAESMGNLFSTCALFMQMPVGKTPAFMRPSVVRKFFGGERSFKSYLQFLSINLFILICRIPGTLFYLLSFLKQGHDDYAQLFCVLCEKAVCEPTADLAADG